MDRKELIYYIKNNKKVKYENIEYLPIAYILRFINNEWLHSVELKSLKTNSVLIVSIERIDKSD